jgi:DNA-binding CsgD family transcriptional regulator
MERADVDRKPRFKDRSAAVLIGGAANLLKSLTTRRFCAAVLQHVTAIVHVDHCALVRLTPRFGIQLFGAESVKAFVANGARAIVRYVDRHHRSDAIRRALYAPDLQPDVLLHRERASDINDGAYRRDCYDQAGIVDRLSVAAVDSGGGLVSLELHRQASSGEFTEAERDDLAAAAPLLAAACTRHIELLVLASVDADSWRARLVGACATLTERELDVAAHLLAGRTLRDCAAALGLAYSSVVTYCERVYSRLGVRNLRELRTRFEAAAQQARESAS